VAEPQDAPTLQVSPCAATAPVAPRAKTSEPLV
jgi:hypothetical protein